MSLETFIQAMPKAELGIQLEGAVSKQTLLLIAEQNEIAAGNKGFNEVVKQLDKPNYEKLPEFAAIVSQWVRHPDDLSRFAYDVGVSLSKQNVLYAEIGVNPLLYMTHTGMSFEQFAEALHDGSDKAQRGWKVQIQWVLNASREEPRRADDVLRWATSATGRKHNFVAFGLTGREELQPAAQFERIFKGAEKKACPRVVHAGDKQGAEGTLAALESLVPERIIGGWGTADAPDVIQKLVENNVLLVVSMARQLCLGRIPTYADYPVRHLYNEGVRLSLTSHMPMFYKTTLTDEYLALVEHNDFTLEELEDIALNAVRYSLLAEDQKADMLAAFRAQYTALRGEHIPQETP
jgi:adenosine deaminase